MDAIVLLGCRSQPGRALTGAGERRVTAAARAWFDGLAPTIVVSGGRRWDGLAETEVLGRALVSRGVPPSALISEWWSMSTAENARYVAELLLPLRRHVGVVTCDWHMDRARRCFEHAGFRVHSLPAPSPHRPSARRLGRQVRERLSWLLDRRATWGWTDP